MNRVGAAGARRGLAAGRWAVRASALWLCLAPACASRVDTELRPLSLDPASAPAGREVPVRILGQGFLADRSVDFGRGSIEIDTGFDAWLGDTALAGVRLIDASTLEATVPATLAVGSYDLRVRGPTGAEGTLAAAFEVAPECLVDLDCADGDVCNGRERCVAGRCAPGEPLECAGSPCVIASCDPDVGCLSEPSPSSPDTAGVCLPSLPPVVAITVTPPAVEPGTVVWADASATSDDLDPLAALQFAWDWGDGGGFAVGGPTDSHVYEAAGEYTLWVEATDTGGHSGLASVDVVVASPSALMIVTRGDDPPLGMPPCSSGDLTLREALACAQKSAAHDVILVQSGVTVVLSSSLGILPDSAGVDVLGYGATIHASDFPTDCVVVQGGGLYLAGFEITGCQGLGINIIAGSGTRVADCWLHDNGGGVTIGWAGNVFGPGNDVSTRSSSAGVHGIQLNQPAVVVGNRVHGNSGAGIYVNHHGAPTSTIDLNVIYANGLAGVFVNNSDGNLLWLNTIADNAGSGVELVSSANIELRDDVLSGNGAFGVDADQSSSFALLDHDAFFQNVSGTCRTSSGSGYQECPGLAASLVGVDPLFIDAVHRDYRLAVGSPLREAGVDVGVDFNGPEPGNFDGLGPNIGAWQLP